MTALRCCFAPIGEVVLGDRKKCLKVFHRGKKHHRNFFSEGKFRKKIQRNETSFEKELP